jgi:ATP-dependent DNA helicase RecG
LNERQIEALLLWKNEGEITTGKYRSKFKITDRTALRDLKELVNLGLLKKIGDKKATKYIYTNSPPKNI